MLKFAYQPHVPSYYAATANDSTRHPSLQGAISADVCVIGGGLTGISTALNLAERDYSVVVLEASKIGWGASGRNGGQLIGGYACGIDTFAQYMPREDVQRVWTMGLESAGMVRERVQKHGIDCDLTSGFLTAANKPRHADELRAWRDEAASRFDYHGYRYVERGQLSGFVDSDRYVGGLYDDNSGHLHPLNYTLGLARAAHEAGVYIYEATCASSVEKTAHGHRVTCEHGHVDARYVVLACNAYLGSLAPALARKIMPAGTFVIATEPLDEARAQALLPTNAAVCDTKFPLDYFRFSKDRRLLWGGKASPSTRMPARLVEAMRGDMLKTFPQLADMKIDYAWGGFVDITMNRAPHFGRIEPTVYFAQGFSGHGVNVTGLAGLLIAEAIDAQAARFDLFEKIRHRDFPGGRMLRAPMLALAMAWNTMRDAH
ncbi:gamma-glutamylputrescine oxidase [Paraburkholderia sp. BL23I1N1]|uniref:NAD(P)/FAD-dependent oxidoreductase n=1 Tax=Paraburkholderia sp. BL23I1N1 TaxID=1938802 RepID=UPI000E7268B0|nr:FAD-binding oxidoreductase [Paraburkholderia sp. BL23I1N1]RKE39635.1 gamma-glutamylputrescine oxidase [Paraburkholderia sp. BL23I1N1]